MSDIYAACDRYIGYMYIRRYRLLAFQVEVEVPNSKNVELVHDVTNNSGSTKIEVVKYKMTNSDSYFIQQINILLLVLGIVGNFMVE